MFFVTDLSVCRRRRVDFSFARLTAAVVTTTSVTLSSDKFQNDDIPVSAHLGCPGIWPSNVIVVVVFVLAVTSVYAEFPCILQMGSFWGCVKNAKNSSNFNRLAISCYQN